MTRLPKRRIAVLVALVAVLAGGTAVALGATGGSSSRPHHGRHGARRHAPLLGAAASYLGVSAVQLRADLRSGETLAQVAASTPGHTEAGLIAALVAARSHALTAGLSERIATLVKTPGGRHSGTRSPRGPLREAALQYLGLTPAQVAQQLRSGKSLAEIADATPGKSADGLIEAVVSAARARLEAVASAGHLTPAREAARLAALRERVTRLVNRTRPVAAARTSG